MYFLMNKNNVVATFDKKLTTAFSDKVLFEEGTVPIPDFWC